MAEKKQPGITSSYKDNYDLHIAFSLVAWATFEGLVIPYQENTALLMLCLTKGLCVTSYEA